MFWLVATFARCRALLDDDAGFRAAVADLTGLWEPRDPTACSSCLDARPDGVLDLIVTGRTWWSFAHVAAVATTARVARGDQVAGT